MLKCPIFVDATSSPFPAGSFHPYFPPKSTRLVAPSILYPHLSSELLPLCVPYPAVKQNMFYTFFLPAFRQGWVFSPNGILIGLLLAFSPVLIWVKLLLLLDRWTENMYGRTALLCAYFERLWSKMHKDNIWDNFGFNVCALAKVSRPRAGFWYLSFRTAGYLFLRIEAPWPRKAKYPKQVSISDLCWTARCLFSIACFRNKCA